MTWEYELKNSIYHLHMVNDLLTWDFIFLITPSTGTLESDYSNSEYALWLDKLLVQFSSVQSLSRVLLFATPWITAHQASLSITNSRSLLKLMPIKSVVPSSHLILCHPLLLLPPIPPSIRVFSNESTPHEVAKVLEFQLQHQSFQWTLRTDLL